MAKQKKMSAAVQAAASVAAKQQKPNEDKLKHLRKRLEHARQLDLELQDLVAHAAVRQAELTKMRTEELPTMFEELRITRMDLEADGNFPAYDVALKPFYNAKLPDGERAAAAYKKFKWLHELRKNTFTVKFGKGDDKKAKALLAFLRKTKTTSYDNKMSVNAATLTAEIRRRFEAGEPLAPADLELLGAYVGSVVTIDQHKQRKK